MQNVQKYNQKPEEEIKYQLEHKECLLVPVCIGNTYILTWEGNTGYHILWQESESHSVISNSLWPHGLYSPQNSPGQNTGVGSLSLLQGIFPTQGSNPGLLHCRWVLHQLSHQWRPRILEWVVYPFSRGSSWARNWTGVSYITGRFFTNWVIREAHTVTRVALQGAFLAVLWLIPCLFMQGVPVQSLVRELRSHMPQNIKQELKDFKNGPHKKIYMFKKRKKSYT